jgi:hypothetical protein
MINAENNAQERRIFFSSQMERKSVKREITARESNNNLSMFRDALRLSPSSKCKTAREISAATSDSTSVTWKFGFCATTASFQQPIIAKWEGILCCFFFVERFFSCFYHCLCFDDKECKENKRHILPLFFNNWGVWSAFLLVK